MSNMDYLKEYLPESLNLREFDILSVKTDTIGDDMQFTDEAANMLITRYQTIEMDLYSSTTGMEIHIKIPYIEMPKAKVTHPKKLLL